MEKLEARLTQRNIKPTAVRLSVLDHLLNRKTAVSLSILENNFEKADRVTLYRTLKTFEEKKLIHAIDDGTGALKYALCKESCECSIDDLHVHFHCNKCKETYCLEQSQIPNISIPPDFKLEEVNMVMKGVCASCHSS